MQDATKMDEHRINHSLAVAKKMIEIGKTQKFSNNQLKEYHGKNAAKYQSKYLNLLNSADMQINSRGEDVGYQKRLEDIASRYGIESDTYKDCSKLIENLLV